MAGDPFWMKGLLVVHIAAGFGSFLLAPVALATAKGGKAHKRWGMVYFISMGVVAATALPMSLYRPVLFLALVAIFSFYASFRGYRVLKLKDMVRGGSAKPIDWAVGLLTFAAGAALVLCAYIRPILIQNLTIPAYVFGAIALRTSSTDLLSFARKPTEKMFWWYRHIEGFLGSYIAAWSAFSVVTLPRIFGQHVVLWLWPTAIGVPAMIATIGYYKRKFTPRSQTPNLPAVPA